MEFTYKTYLYTVMKSGLLILLFLTGYWVIGQSPWMGNTSPDYPTLIRHLQKLDKTSDRMSMYIMGPSDVPGLPIYLCVLNAGKDSLETFTKAQRGTTLLFNNAIHPGEPDGINASLLYAENYLKLDSVNPTDPLVAFIPAYNVGGMLNRSSTSRANQNGPVEYGFRGNAQNLDLNRDFIKMDSENARTFVQIFHALKPDVFIDNHVSNGADYQYTLTYISSVRERIAPALRKLIYGTLLPQLTQDLKSSKWDLFPYVETVKETPDSGIYQFNDLPRYAMGYASLFNCVAFTVETHMLKPFPNRVRATYDFMVSLIRWSVKNARQIEQARENANEWESFRPYFRYNYTRTSEADSIVFKGFKAVVDTHQITGLGHLKYDRTQPYQKSIPFYKCYVPKDSLPIPQFYIIRGQELRIIEHLRNNGFLMDVLKEEKKLRVYAQIVRSFDAISKPYEGHYMHTNKEIERVEKWITFRPGDVVIPSNQNGSLFLHSVLQPEAEDSYFTWNYFDSYLQEKEYFSNYVFVDKIRSILQSNPELRQEYEAKKRSDSEFASSEWQQLYFLYQHSPFFEPSYMMLPVFELK
ncbi:MAG: hypothetical protein FJY06_00065 [Bacteroidetes bacterium]|nr:hypothetical protein [Bacteroidota bacterium]